MIQDSECETGSGYLSELLGPLDTSQEGSAICHQEKRANKGKSLGGRWEGDGRGRLGKESVSGSSYKSPQIQL